MELGADRPQHGYVLCDSNHELSQIADLVFEVFTVYWVVMYSEKLFHLIRATLLNFKLDFYTAI